MDGSARGMGRCATGQRHQKRRRQSQLPVPIERDLVHPPQQSLHAPVPRQPARPDPESRQVPPGIAQLVCPEQRDLFPPQAETRRYLKSTASALSPAGRPQIGNPQPPAHSGPYPRQFLQHKGFGRTHAPHRRPQLLHLEHQPRRRPQQSQDLRNPPPQVRHAAPPAQNPASASCGPLSGKCPLASDARPPPPPRNCKCETPQNACLFS